MNYLAILGRQPELGLVELESVLGSAGVSRFGRHALIGKSATLNRLGGVVKLGRIIARLPQAPLDQLKFDLGLIPLPTSKICFGVSVYGLPRSTRVNEFGINIKRRLQAHGSVRYVAPAPRTSELSAAQLKYNQLPESGFELLIAGNNQEIVVALTEQYQDIDAYAARDHGRPVRDARVGMLPPKLAQILVNTTHATTIYDPFCGTGVVLQEALLNGRWASGSDQSDEMVSATTTNLEWLATRYADPKLPLWTVYVANALKVKIPPGCAIVSEGYLGPNLTKPPSVAQLKDMQHQLGELYSATLAHLSTQLLSGAEVSLCLPCWRIGSDWHLPFGVVDDIGRLGYTYKVFTTVNAPLRYARPDQIVGRHILLLTRS